MFHIALHFIVPAVITSAFFQKNWRQAYLIMIATMVVDIDHFLASPVYDPNRCSIGFHPLHEPWFVLLYLAMCFVPGRPILRLIGIGLTIHMVLDAIDCQVTGGVWMSQLV